MSWLMKLTQQNGGIARNIKKKSNFNFQNFTKKNNLFQTSLKAET